jgi:hypothetical protein
MVDKSRLAPNEQHIWNITEGVQKGKHIHNERCRLCANFRVNECLIDFITKKT